MYKLIAFYILVAFNIFRKRINIINNYFFSYNFIMTKFTRSSNGKYVVSGKSYEMLIGTRAQVWHGTAFKTTGGLNKNDLMQNKGGRIVSRAKHNSAKREKRLVKAGYLTKKGHFGFIKKGKTSRRHSKKGGNAHAASHSAHNAPHHGTHNATHHTTHHKGGAMSSLSPSSYSGKGVATSGVNLQFVAGNAN
jgi:hypothetical protein